METGSLCTRSPRGDPGDPQTDPNVPLPAGVADGETEGRPAPAGLTPPERAQTARG